MKNTTRLLKSSLVGVSFLPFIYIHQGGIDQTLSTLDVLVILTFFIDVLIFRNLYDYSIRHGGIIKNSNAVASRILLHTPFVFTFVVGIPAIVENELGIEYGLLPIISIFAVILAEKNKPLHLSEKSVRTAIITVIISLVVALTISIGLYRLVGIATNMIILAYMLKTAVFSWLEFEKSDSNRKAISS